MTPTKTKYRFPQLIEIGTPIFRPAKYAHLAKAYLLSDKTPLELLSKDQVRRHKRKLAEEHAREEEHLRIEAELERERLRLEAIGPLHDQPAEKWPGLNGYGNYADGIPLPADIVRIPKDGSIRRIKKANVDYREIVDVVNSYGDHWFPQVTGYAVHDYDLSNIDLRPVKRAKPPNPHPDLLLCIREASRAAHRERDLAQECYQERRHTAASNARQRKEQWYSLKERGIAASHKQGVLRYIGRTPQELAVYEYGDGGMSCFHSTLHPAGEKRSLIEDHPEVLQVVAKDKIKGVSLERIKLTLEELVAPIVPQEYERTDAPRIEREGRPVECWECGGNHHRRDCPEIDDWDDECDDWEAA
jgi:hypothetical protein